MKVTIPIEVLSIQGDGFHLFVPIKIGRKKFRMLVDTGASRTVFDIGRIAAKLPEIEMEQAEKLSTGLGVAGVAGKVAELGTINFSGIKRKNYTTMLLDLSHVNTSYAELGFEAIDGVLGSDLLHAFGAVIHYKKSTLTLSKKS